jgi:hypothetical protein
LARTGQRFPGIAPDSLISPMNSTTLWNMTQKPGTGEAIAAEIVGYVAGAAVAIAVTRGSAKAVSAVPDVGA